MEEALTHAIPNVTYTLTFRLTPLNTRNDIRQLL